MSEASNNASNQETLDVVLFSADGWRAGFEARQVRASRPASAGAAGEDVEALLGFVRTTFTQVRQCLQLKLREGDREILVGTPVDLVSLPVSAIHPLPVLLSARCTLNGLRALAFAPESDTAKITLLFSAEGL